jgi:transcriptional regulator with PAS, ATPase and Fis domain
MMQHWIDTSIWWYEGHIWLSYNYIAPLDKTLNKYGAFGGSSIEYLSYALEIWLEWELKEGRDIEETPHRDLTVFWKQYKHEGAESMQTLLGWHSTKEELMRTLEMSFESQSRAQDLLNEQENVEATLQSEEQKSAYCDTVSNLKIDLLEHTMKSPKDTEKMLIGTMSSLTEKSENAVAENYCAILNHIKDQEATLRRQKCCTRGMIDAPMLTMCHMDHTGRFLIVNKAAYTDFGWSVSKVFGSTFSINPGNAHAAKRDQHVKWYLKAGEKHTVGRQCNAKNHLDTALIMAQEVKVSLNILYQDKKSLIILEQNGIISSSRNTQKINKCLVFNSRIVPNKVEIQDRQT